MVPEVTTVERGERRALATLRRHGERYERARENGESARGVSGVMSDATVSLSDATVSLADAGEITGPGGYGGWESAIGRPPARKKGELKECGREVSSKRERGRRAREAADRQRLREGAWP